MKNHSSTYRYIALILMGLLLLPLLVNHLPGIPKAHVFGVEEQQDSVSGSWLDGSAQRQFEKKLMDHSVSRTYLLRFRNQYQYTLFGKINANNIYKFGDYYFRFYTPSFNDASNFIGKDSIEHTLDEIVQLQHYLGDSIPVITIIPPSKNYYYQQFLPERNRTKSTETNYHYVLAGLKQKQLHHIDFNDYFLNNRSEIPAIFAKGGIHWTSYASTVAADSLMKYISFIKNEHYDSFTYDTVYHNGFNVDDLDLELLRNILMKPKDPRLRDVIITPKKGKKRLKAVIVGDSFFFTIHNSGARKAMFTDYSFYHYYFSRTYNSNLEVVPFDIHKIKAAMKEADCILLVNDITNLQVLGFGFPRRINYLFQ